jgi:membrane protein
MTSSHRGAAPRSDAQPGVDGRGDPAKVTAQPTDTGARPDLDDDDPDSPTELSRPSLVAVLTRVRQQIGQDGLTDLAAALTYYAVLSIVPGLVVLISLLGVLGPDAATQVADQAQAIAPGSSSTFVHALITQAQANKGGAGLSAFLGIGVALWSASGYVAAFMRAANVVYGIGEGRPIWKTLPIRLGVTIAAVILLVASALIVVLSGPVAHQVGNILGAGDTTVLIWSIAKWPVLLILVSVLLALLFWASPNAQQAGIKWVSPGALYVATFASYDKTYGSLAGVVIFLVWLWLSNLAILLGAEVNAELDHAKAIAEGLPEDAQPFARPRDTRKLDDEQKHAIEAAQATRHD